MDADAVAALIAARCPELSADDLAELQAALAGRPPIALPPDVAAKIVDVLDRLNERLEALEEASEDAA